MEKKKLTCRSCGAPIIFIISTKGHRIPCDAEPVKFDYELGGPDKVVTQNGEVLPGRISENGAETGYISHFATCPNANAHRRRYRHD